jgi:16S rRNA A1518/A1519 N6-dimethyltransferase RsmA/KsgA/DIM1 with predicted DNA glycosylase/AP lyase activity
MHVFSSAQFQTLINWDQLNPRLDRLLDIGAGDGEPTRQMESCFNQVSVTEMSIPMKWSLEKKGYR